MSEFPQNICIMWSKWASLVTECELHRCRATSGSKQKRWSGLCQFLSHIGCPQSLAGLWFLVGPGLESHLQVFAELLSSKPPSLLSDNKQITPCSAFVSYCHLHRMNIDKPKTVQSYLDVFGFENNSVSSFPDPAQNTVLIHSTTTPLAG